jgi:adenosylcobinamide-GDP ribazoletransferase
MGLIRTLCLAFSMYSRIPMPYLEYKEEDMKYVFLFFPFIGVVIGALELAWHYLCSIFEIGNMLYSAVAVAVPFFVTGGFHMDGFLDTTDALSSYGDRNKKLEILKDSHVGAFAVIWSGVYLVLNMGAYGELYNFTLIGKSIALVSFVYILSRITSGLAAVVFPSANSDKSIKSSLAELKRVSSKRVVAVGLVIYLILSFIFIFMVNAILSLFVFVALGLCFLYYYYMSKKNFGGITGDLAGWYLQVCELVLLLVIVILGRWSVVAL